MATQRVRRATQEQKERRLLQEQRQRVRRATQEEKERRLLQEPRQRRILQEQREHKDRVGAGWQVLETVTEDAYRANDFHGHGNNHPTNLRMLMESLNFLPYTFLKPPLVMMAIHRLNTSSSISNHSTKAAVTKVLASMQNLLKPGESRIWEVDALQQIVDPARHFQRLADMPIETTVMLVVKALTVLLAQPPQVLNAVKTVAKTPVLEALDMLFKLSTITKPLDILKLMNLRVDSYQMNIVRSMAEKEILEELDVLMPPIKIAPKVEIPLPYWEWSAELSSRLSAILCISEEGNLLALTRLYYRMSNEQPVAIEKLVAPDVLLALIGVSHPNVTDVLSVISPDVYDLMSELVSLTEPPLVYPTREVLDTLILLEDPLVTTSLDALVALGAPKYAMALHVLETMMDN